VFVKRKGKKSGAGKGGAGSAARVRRKSRGGGGERRFGISKNMCKCGLLFFKDL